VGAVLLGARGFGPQRQALFPEQTLEHRVHAVAVGAVESL
jgi:hypothetical protein